MQPVRREDMDLRQVAATIRDDPRGDDARERAEQAFGACHDRRSGRGNAHGCPLKVRWQVSTVGGCAPDANAQQKSAERRTTMGDAKCMPPGVHWEGK